MQSEASELDLEFFSTCPSSIGFSPNDYREKVADVARWSEKTGCRGILVDADRSLVDPWLVSQLVIESTESLSPVVAVQPAHMHPCTVAKMVASFGHLYRRRVYLNLVSGGFGLVEYTLMIQALLKSDSPVGHDGKSHRVEKLKLTPALASDLQPEVFVSDSSEAGMEVARLLGATAVKCPGAATEGVVRSNAPVKTGIRMGMIARASDEEAWDAAQTRFARDRERQAKQHLAVGVSASVRNEQLSEPADPLEGSLYWLMPFPHSKTTFPYLVGSYRCVGEEIRRYVGLGVRCFILDVPPDEAELCHTNQAFQTCLAMRSS